MDNEYSFLKFLKKIRENDKKQVCVIIHIHLNNHKICENLVNLVLKMKNYHFNL